jgi:hypothetical protein
MSSSRVAAVMASTASPSATPGARLNETVVAGNWPWCVTASAVVPGSMRVKAASGIGVPPTERT